MPGINLIFKVTGANVSSATGVTDSNGQALFTYTGTAAGSDLVQVSAGNGGMSVVSNLLSVTWGLPPAPSLHLGRGLYFVTLPSPLLLSATVTTPPLLRRTHLRALGAR